ncbi:E3 ubiquitin-protein ligase APD2 isoform X3 [Cryptomeria japonica]|uniref:E3 ubiquitin-protein ligase APD2 isoform X3 n=1 Tax=Cryptomeria japonica TaxID=3369 RepID=UPI0025AD3D54|nr:E3 ubiquitin-protein ligase APD2 isoform X3 [Cryptomeria japonica]
MPRGVYGGVTRGYYYTYSFPQHESREECWACMIIPITFWIFASLTLSLGVYGTSQLVLAPNYSHLIEASPIFVKEIQEFAVWLNAGSKFWLSCEDKSFGFLDILLVVLKGEESLQEWIQDPSNPHLGLLRLKISGYGETEYIVKEDGNYYFVVGNFNQHSAEVVMRLNFTSKMYNTQTANYKCSMGKGLCAVKLSILQNSYALLTTPSGSNITGGRSVWSVELSYGARLLTYIIILGVIILVVYCIFRILGHLDQTTQTNTEPEESERTPLIPPKESTSDLSTYGTLGQDQESGLNSSTEDLYDGKICVICYDEPRSCFFVPCGHCATCYTCGQRIEIGENKTCPICRHTISKVKRLYNA